MWSRGQKESGDTKPGSMGSAMFQQREHLEFTHPHARAHMHTRLHTGAHVSRYGAAKQTPQAQAGQKWAG